MESSARRPLVLALLACCSRTLAAASAPGESDPGLWGWAVGAVLAVGAALAVVACWKSRAPPEAGDGDKELTSPGQPLGSSLDGVLAKARVVDLPAGTPKGLGPSAAKASSLGGGRSLFGKAKQPPPETLLADLVRERLVGAPVSVVTSAVGGGAVGAVGAASAELEAGLVAGFDGVHVSVRLDASDRIVKVLPLQVQRRAPAPQRPSVEAAGGAAKGGEKKKRRLSTTYIDGGLFDEWNDLNNKTAVDGDAAAAVAEARRLSIRKEVNCAAVAAAPRRPRSASKVLNSQG